ncbi:Phospholipase A(1) DAD1 [Chlorella vulgaris]
MTSLGRCTRLAECLEGNGLQSNAQRCHRNWLRRRIPPRTAAFPLIRHLSDRIAQRNIRALAAAAENNEVAAAVEEGRQAAEEGRQAAATFAESLSVDDPADDPSTAFDWQLCLVLAGCAFEAYNDIEKEAPATIKMTSMGGVQTSFVDERFLQAKFDGILEVTVVGGKGLPVGDWWPGARSDPYVVLNIGDSAAATSVVKQTLEPHDLAKQRLTVRVLDADTGKADDLLGSTMRGLQDIADGQVHCLELPLRQCRGSRIDAGTLSLRVRFMSFADGLLAEEAAANQMGDPVLGSPPQTILTSEWRSLQKEVLDPSYPVFHPACYMEHPDTDTQVWIFWSPETRGVCVSFRGTEQAKWKDILTDLSLVPSSLEPEGITDPGQQAWKRRDAGSAPDTSPAPNLEAAVAAMKTRRQEFRSSLVKGLQGIFERKKEQQQQMSAQGKDEPVVWVHHGFLDAYAAVRSEVLRLLETVLGSEEEGEEPWTLYVTGHSLGGALSTLCTYDCARRTWRNNVARPKIVHYNFGSPRVGNRAFAEDFDRLVPNTWRVANSKDAVALVPRMLGYCHVGHKAQLGADGELDVMRNSSKAPGEGAEMGNVALAAAVNLPMLTELLLDKQQAAVDSASADGDSNNPVADALQQTKPLLVGAATAVASAAIALAGSQPQLQQQLQEDAARDKQDAPANVVATANAVAEAHTPEEVMGMLEEEIRAMIALLDGSALDDHLEPLYLSSIAAAIEKLRELSEQ